MTEENFVNRIKTSDGTSYDVRDSRLEKVPVSETAGSALRVTKVDMSGPTPVAEFDGVKYYHKHEFDLVELANLSGRYSLLSGEQVEFGVSSFSIGRAGPDTIIVLAWSPTSYSLDYILYSIPGNVYQSNYTSRSFTVVHDQSEVTDNTKICLPDNVTAYYGFLSEDGNTFISYWNEEGESGPTEITEVTDDENTLPIHDERLIKATAADVGKVLSVDAEGNYVLTTPASGGTKLYKHDVVFNYTATSTSGTASVYVITNSADLFKEITGGGPTRYGSDGTIISIYSSTSILAATYYNEKCVAISHIIVNTILEGVTINSLVSDTVTEL